jgi:hypothetical protein
MLDLVGNFILVLQLLTISGHPVVLRDYGVYPVGDYDTVMTFYFNFYNTVSEPGTAVVQFKKCCLIVTEDDVACDIMELADQHSIKLNPYSPATIVFRFHSYVS